MSGQLIQPEAILEWLQKEMGYRLLGLYASFAKASMATADSLQKISRGNMIPVWNFLLKRVKSEKTVENISRNIIVHGNDDGLWSKQRRKEELKVGKEGLGESSSSSSSREIALQERELAEKEVERLRQIVRQQRKQLKTKIIEVSREAVGRKQMLDELSNYRHKKAILEAYDQQCNEAAKIFSEYHKRLRYYVNQARDTKRSSIDSHVEIVSSFHANSEKEALHSTVKGAKSADDVILIEAARERSIRKVCKYLVVQMYEKILSSFPAFDGVGVHANPQLEASKFCIDTDGDLPIEIRDVVVDCLKSPPHLLLAITSYTQGLKNHIIKEIDKTYVRAAVEILRYKYEDDVITEASSNDGNSPLQYHLCGNGKIGDDGPARGT